MGPLRGRPTRLACICEGVAGVLPKTFQDGPINQAWAHPLPMLGFLCTDPLCSAPPPLSSSVPEAPSLILPSVRFQSNDEAACV